MRPILTCLPILVTLTISASAQSNDRAFPIPEGRAYFCEYTRAETKIGDRRVGKPGEKLGKAIGIITSDAAYHCTQSTCYRFTHSPSLSKTSQVYIDDSDGTRLITNAFALEFDGGIMFESSLKGAMAITTLSGHCKETSREKLIEVLKTFSDRQQKPKR